MHLRHRMGSASRRALRNIYIIYIVPIQKIISTQNVFNIIRNLNIIYTIYYTYIVKNLNKFIINQFL